jgi:biopolymer transport protein ExbD
MQFKRRRELKRTKIEIIPMIDTMFFLLVFFMLSSLAMTHLMGIPVVLPKAATSKQQHVTDLTVTIDKSQQVYLNRDHVDPTNLGAAILRRTAGADVADVSVILNADLSVPHGLVVQCMDAARGVGATKFIIATAPQGTGG